MKVRIPTPLRSYTHQQPVVEADGTTLDDLLVDLDRRYRGLRFRIVDEQGQLRPHVKIFVGDESARDLTTPVDGTEEIVIMQALSGGGADRPRVSPSAARPA